MGVGYYAPNLRSFRRNNLMPQFPLAPVVLTAHILEKYPERLEDDKYWLASARREGNTVNKNNYHFQVRAREIYLKAAQDVKNLLDETGNLTLMGTGQTQLAPNSRTMDLVRGFLQSRRKKRKSTGQTRSRSARRRSSSTRTPRA